MLDLDLYNVPRSNLNMLIESLHATSYLMAIVMFVLSFTACTIFTVKVCMILTLTFRMNQDKKYNNFFFLDQRKGSMRLYLLAITIFALFVNVCKLFTVEVQYVYSTSYSIAKVASPYLAPFTS